VIPRIEALAERVTSEDIVLVEARASSDVHMLALPLAYIYAKNVLVFRETMPDRDRFYEFLSWARGRYRRIYYCGGQGTSLASSRATVVPVAMERFQVPEYESTADYPRRALEKVYDFGIYEFGAPGDRRSFDLDVGSADDLHVRRFFLKETARQDGTTYRWSRDVSFVSVPGVPDGAHKVTVWLSDGGRPPSAPPARVAVHLNDVTLGDIEAGRAVLPYEFPIPPALAANLAANRDMVELKLVTNTWNPRHSLGAADQRDLGVMVDRIRID
jgi:hypothetical protein